MLFPLSTILSGLTYVCQNVVFAQPNTVGALISRKNIKQSKQSSLAKVQKQKMDNFHLTEVFLS